MSPENYSGIWFWCGSQQVNVPINTFDKTLFSMIRNFGYKWEDKRPKANRPCSQVYHGLAPFSELETRAIRVDLREIDFFL